jgi:hypothetical protein
MPKCVRGKRRRRGRKLCCMRYDEFCEDGEESTRIIDNGSMPKEEKCTASVSTVTHPEHPYHPDEACIEDPLALEEERSIWVALQDNALLLLLLLGQERGACGVFENLTDTLICLCRTLKVLVGTNLLANLLTLCIIISLILIFCSMRAVFRDNGGLPARE